ncbi:hypothetical protein ACF0H5_006475 [Mactra antiquata]
MDLMGLLLRVGLFSATCACSYGLLTTSEVPQEVIECIQRIVNVTDGRLSNKLVEEAHLQCIQTFFWKFNGIHWSATNITEDDKAYINSLMRLHVRRGRQKRQVGQEIVLPLTGFRTRKEYRILTDEERNTYHAAVNELKRVGRYDIFANIHQGTNIDSAHGGPNFLGWHRIYLALYEEALREVNGTVALPFWDSRLDFHMADPVDSIIWTAAFLGNGDGFVRTGPFANWNTPTGRLARNIGRFSTLMSAPVVDDILTRCQMSEISEPTAVARYNLEFHHGGPHVWVGGQMRGLDTAAHEPVFFMHHAFVDYVWELFRIRQATVCRIDPGTDYPSSATGLHAPNRAMDGLPQFRNIDGIANYWTEFWYNYEDTPICSPRQQSCGSPYLRCDVRIWRCISESRVGPRVFATDITTTYVANRGLTEEQAHALMADEEASSVIEGAMFRGPTADPRNH